MGYLSPKACLDANLPERYLPLKNLLLMGQWEQANRETTTLLLDAAGCTDAAWLWVEDLAKLPPEELLRINQLWLNYSKGRFGFSVQQRIWRKAVKLGEYEAECYVGDRVGWRDASGTWLVYDQITFDYSAPRGHLPLAFAWWVEGAGVVLGGMGKFWQVKAPEAAEAMSQALIAGSEVGYGSITGC